MFDQEPAPAPTPSGTLPLGTRQVRAVWVLLTINVAVFVLTTVLSFLLPRVPSLLTFLVNHAPYGSLAGPTNFVLSLGWKDNELITQGQYWRLITAIFLHGGLLHIAFNGFALYALGPETERIYGTLRFVALYFVAGLSGSVASYVFTTGPSVGASGAIFGLIGGLAVFFYTTRNILGEFSRRQLQSMVTIVVVNILIGVSAGGVIDNFAHLGGLVGGIVGGWFLAPRYHVSRQFYPPRLERRTSPQDWIGVGGTVLVSGVIVGVVGIIRLL
ncbi:MAG: rhomboid family intramembrane serine protease [Chloroflexaceae bacterium]|nr:rhomboid family intramembrane serine protease [Chloroflexaceae bacterium]